MKKQKGKLAQLSIYGIISLVIGLIVLAALFPVIKDSVETAKSNATTTTETTVLDLIPIMIILAFIMTIFIYLSVQRPQQYG